MRKNLPVTGIEYILRDDVAIVSKTDLKGKITYVNPYFIEVSGFTEDGLLGAPHNLVRHPDMPAEAFSDMWATLKAGMPWTGLVKNRRKNGDFYWVKANVTPTRDGDRVTGFMSVRTKPARDQVDAAERLYARIRSGQAKGIEIRQGAVVRTGLPGWGDRLRNLSFARSLALKMSSMCMLMLAVSLLILPALARQSAELAMLAGMLLGIGFVGTLWSWRSFHIAVVQPVREATKTARAIAGGDLSTSFDVSRRRRWIRERCLCIRLTRRWRRLSPQ